MQHSTLVYIAVMSAVTLSVKILPLTLIRKPIRSRFVRSFLFYVPYVTLAVMTFPAIVQATDAPLAGAIALVAGIVAAWFGASLFQVAATCCALVFVIELFLV
ncbi:MAG: AzlD domain-containing protein [Coriobacteriales bacterium]|nr:AzlD domain-containing protein [Coriobacteriales bacterium]